MPLFYFMEVWHVTWVLGIGFTVVLVGLYLAKMGENRLGQAIGVLYYGPAILACAYWVKGDVGIIFVGMATVTTPIFCIENKNKSFIAFVYGVLFLCLLGYPLMNVTEQGIYSIPVVYQLPLKITCLTSFFSYTMIQFFYFMNQHKIMKEEEKKYLESILRYSRFSDLSLVCAGVSHEINNPLSIIQGHARLLKREINPNAEKANKSLLLIEDSCERIAKIVSGLKKFSNEGEKEPKQDVNLKVVIQDVYLLLREKLQNNGVKVYFELPPEVSSIQGNPVQLRQVFVSLFTNSLEAIRDREEKWIKILITENENQIAVEFVDSGPGIPKGDVGQIMNPFFTTKEVGEGPGLGLSIAKGILDEHKAFIHVAQEAPHTTFVLKFNS